MTLRLLGISLLAVLVAWWLLPDFYITLLDYIGLYALVALGIVLLTGVAGITSFGQAAFVGLSAYATAVVAYYAGLSPWLGLLAGLGLTVVAALVIGGITLRLSGHYLPLGTIAWGLSLYYVFGNLEFLGGHTGLTDIRPISIGALSIQSSRDFLLLIWIVLLVAMLLVGNMLDSRAGRAMRAVKSSRVAAESFGIDTSRVRLEVFVYAAVLASISGWLYTHMLRFLNPSPFSLSIGIEYLFMAVVGGAGHIWGAILGAGIITGLKEVLQSVLPGLIGRAGSFEVVVFGTLVIALLQFNGDRGLGALMPRALRLIGRKPRSVHALSDPLPLRNRSYDGAERTVLEVIDLQKSFGGLKALKQVSFSVSAGEILGIIGPNGAGKSTLFDVISGLQRPDAGSVRILGENVGAGRPRDVVAKGVARSFQHVHLVPELTVLENTMLGAHLRSRSGSIGGALSLNKVEERQLHAEAVRQLQRVGLADLLYEPALNLPLGKQRLVEIARALCTDPDVLLLDEPAAGLRFREKQDLAALLHELRGGGLSVVLVEHDMGFVMGLCDRLVVMNFGEKLVEGRPEVVRSDQRVIEAYLGASAP